MQKPFKKKLLIDLDGVLNQYNGKFDENFIPPIKEGAKEFIELLFNKDYELYLFTTRNLLLSAIWLKENKLDGFFKDITNIKSPAYLTIDDRAICHNGDFNKTIYEIDNFKAWWKNRAIKAYNFHLSVYKFLQFQPFRQAGL